MQSRKFFTCAQVIVLAARRRGAARRPSGSVFLPSLVSVSGSTSQPPRSTTSTPLLPWNATPWSRMYGPWPIAVACSQIMLKPSNSQSACCVSGVSSASSGNPNLPPTDVADLRRLDAHAPVRDVDHVRAPVGHQAARVVVVPAEVEVEAVLVERPLRRRARATCRSRPSAGGSLSGTTGDVAHPVLVGPRLDHADLAERAALHVVDRVARSAWRCAAACPSGRRGCACARRRPSRGLRRW